jgi:hypothetical protein
MGESAHHLRVLSFTSRLGTNPPHLYRSATSNETGFSGNITADLKGFFPQMTPTDIQEFLDEYPVSEFANVQQRGVDMIGELELRCGVSSRSYTPPFCIMFFHFDL